MNFKTTSWLIEELKPYIKHEAITVNLNSKDLKKRDYKSDYVIVDKSNNVGFEVLDNEIIVFYFSDRYHFEDYSSQLQEGEDDYTKRARDFLTKLFTTRLRHLEIYKGKRLSSEKYYFIYDDKDDEYIGGTWFGIKKFISPFAKKAVKSSTWIYDKQKGIFISHCQKSLCQCNRNN